MDSEGTAQVSQRHRLSVPMCPSRPSVVSVVDVGSSAAPVRGGPTSAGLPVGPTPPSEADVASWWPASWFAEAQAAMAEMYGSRCCSVYILYEAAERARRGKNTGGVEE
eukprot:GHVU01199890.1.p3 GENE.GHVU01199890.1~~GHVU01199890.1.p3  ORF type:complete len:109 (+),score=14.40 GHVU01199890.1:158-484(+)